MTDAVEPPTSVIICSRNRPVLLRDCIDSVLRGDTVPSELIIVDDSDTADHSLAGLSTARSCEIRYVWRQERGLSSAMNFAIREARHDLLVFTQDDAEVEPTWLSSIVRSLVNAGPRTIVTGQVQPGDSETNGGFVSDANIGREPIVHRGRVDHDVLFALNMALYRSAAEEIGPFDERLGPGTHFPASEDNDFGFRALEAGYAIAYDPASVVCHRAWRGEEMYARFRFGYGFSRGGYYAKHMRLRGDRFMLGRFWRDVRNHLAPVPRLARQDRQKAVGHVALASGLVSGATRWKIDELRNRGKWRRRSDPVEGRTEALSEEVDYWRNWLATRGGKWREEFEYRLDPSSEVADAVLREVIERTPRDSVSVIDVGSGPASMVGSVLPGKSIALVAVDPLADDYNRLLDEAHVSPPVRPRRVAGEQLVEAFGCGSFDVAYARNSLDHAVDPVLIIDNMVDVVRPEGRVVVRHVRNEGTRQAYVQLHQWNFDERDGCLVVWRPGVQIDVNAVLAGRAEVKCWVENGDSVEDTEVVAVIRKLDQHP